MTVFHDVKKDRGEYFHDADHVLLVVNVRGGSLQTGTELTSDRKEAQGDMAQAQERAWFDREPARVREEMSGGQEKSS